jgi:hypothetical protein
MAKPEYYLKTDPKFGTYIFKWDGIMPKEYKFEGIVVCNLDNYKIRGKVSPVDESMCRQLEDWEVVKYKMLKDFY